MEEKKDLNVSTGMRLGTQVSVAADNSGREFCWHAGVLINKRKIGLAVEDFTAASCSGRIKTPDGGEQEKRGVDDEGK